MRRIDAIGTMHRGRFGALTGEVLDSGLDDVLQALVRQASDALHLPIALVSLVLERTQFFRAHVGLPPDLVAAGATDRDASFCQFVVRDGVTFEVTNASRDDRVPQELVERYGIQAYLGAPVSIDGTVVGSLCVIGAEPRVFVDEDRATLERIAALVSGRLEELSVRARATSRGLLARAATPAIGEMRNILAALTLNARVARVAAVDARPIAHLLRQLPAEVAAAWPAFGGLRDAAAEVDSFGELVGDIEASIARLVSSLEALESLVTDGGRSTAVADVLDAASRLALHNTKLVGGVAWAPAAQLWVSTPRMVAVSVIASALGAVAEVMGAHRTGIRGSAQLASGKVVIELHATGVDRSSMERCLRELTLLLDEDPHVAATLTDAGDLAIQLTASATPPG